MADEIQQERFQDLDAIYATYATKETEQNGILDKRLKKHIRSNSQLGLRVTTSMAARSRQSTNHQIGMPRSQNSGTVGQIVGLEAPLASTVTNAMA